MRALFRCLKCNLVIPLEQAGWDPALLAWRCPACPSTVKQ